MLQIGDARLDEGGRGTGLPIGGRGGPAITPAPAVHRATSGTGGAIAADRGMEDGGRHGTWQRCTGATQPSSMVTCTVPASRAQLAAEGAAKYRSTPGISVS